MKKCLPSLNRNKSIFVVLFYFFLSTFSLAADSLTIAGIEGLILLEQPSNYQVTISDSFKLHNMTVHPQKLNLRYSTINKSFEIFGGAQIIISKDTINVSFGDSLVAGLLIADKILRSVDITVSGNFKLNKLTITPINLTFFWAQTTYKYNIYGDIKITLEDHISTANLGNMLNPGIVIDSGKVTQINIGVSGNLKLKSLAIKPKNLSIFWERDSSFYKMYGDISLILAKDSLDADLGTVNKPGVVVQNGILTKLDVSLTADFKLRKLVFKPKGLTFIWDEPSKRITIFGNVLVKIESDSLLATLGNAITPGIQITDGTIDTINIAATGNFKLKSLAIKPDSLIFIYDRFSDKYKIFGALELDIENDTIKAGLGNFDEPGIEIIDGVLQKINIEVTTSFKLKSLAIKPDSLTFYYDKNSLNYKIFGLVELDIEKDTIKAQLGTSINPGISITDGKVDHINISVSSHFELKKLTIETDSLGIEWQKSIDGNIYHFFGKVKIDIDTNKIAFDFGSRLHPGIVLRNGKIDTLKISTTDDIHFAGFEVGTENLTVEYSNQFYHMYGKLFLKKIWSAVIDLGTGPGSGVTLDLSSKPAKLMIQQAKFELDDIDLGPITIKDLALSLEQNRVQEADLSVDLPPGWEVGAKMKFKLVDHALDIDAIDISWEAVNIEQAIEIPGTGAFIAKIEGGLYGIEDPHEFTVTGVIDIMFGGPFNIKDVGEVSLLYMHDSITISRSELTLEADALMGAYKKDGTWTSVLGDGHLKFDFKWGESYEFDGSLNIPSDPWTILKADLEAKLSAGGAFNAHIGVHLTVPKKVPVVGGHEFAEAEGVIHYDKTDPTSFAAGWAKLNLGFYTWRGGVKYNFKSKDYTTLGSKDISQYSSPSFGQTSTSGLFIVEYKPITINRGDNPNFLHVKIKFKQKLGSVYVTCQNISTATVPYSPIYVVKGIDAVTSSGIDLSTIPSYNYSLVSNTDSMTLYIMAPGYQQNSKATLPAGVYHLTLKYTGVDNSIESAEINSIYSEPYTFYNDFYISNLPVTTNGLTNLLNCIRLNYLSVSEVYNNDSAKVSLFYSKSSSENGTLITTVKYRDYFVWKPQWGYLNLLNFDLPEKFTNGDSLYLYLTINDGINAVYKSPVMPINFNLVFNAQVKIEGQPDSMASGIETHFYVLNPADNQWYKTDESTRYTNKAGLISFPYFLTANTKVKFVFDIPVGYEVAPSSTYNNGDELFVNAYYGKSVTLLLRRKDNDGELYVR